MKVCLYLILLAGLKCISMEMCQSKFTNNETEVVCGGYKGKSYQAIAQFRNNTTHTYSPNFPQEVFANIRHNIIIELHLSYCNITIIQYTAFANLFYLEVLSLGINTNMSFLPVSRILHTLSRTTIKSLVIKRFHLTYLPDEMFQGLKFTNITNLTLTSGHLGYSDSNVYRQLKTLRHLDIAWFGISKYNVHGFNHLESLRLNRNWEKYVSCFRNSSFERSVVCLDNLEVLSWSRLPCRLLSDKTFSRSPLKKTRHNLVPPYRKYKKFVAVNKFSRLVGREFSGLDSFNRIRLEFTNLINFEVLKMKKLQLENRTEYLIKLSPQMVELYLNESRISSWQKNMSFLNLSSSNFVCMTYDRIGVFNKTLFSSNFHNVSLSAMLFYGNQCSPKDIVTVTVIIFSSVVFLLVALAVIIYKCRWAIRYQLYKIRRRREKEHQSLLNIERHVYAIYVIYSDRDLKWIKEYLVSNIESRHGYQLCLRDRDFLPGNIFVDDMFTKMKESKIIMAILSNDFAKDPWCQFQLAIARDITIEFNKVRIIPILLHEIGFRYLNETVYNFISRVNYLSWNSSATGQELFWEEILGVIK